MSRKFERKTRELLGTAAEPAGVMAGGLTVGSDRLFGTSAGFPHVVELDLAHVRRNPDQPRRHFDEAELRSLASSIERHGLQNPILVRPLSQGEYLLIGGERRVRAHEMLGRKTVFAILTSGDPDEIGLIDNVQRVDLNAVEYAAALARLIDKHGYTHDELAAVVGRDRTDVTKLLAIMGLPAEIREEYATQFAHVSRSVMIEIAAAPAELQDRLWERAKEGASVKAVRQAKREHANGGAAAEDLPPPDAAQEPDAKEAVRALQASVKRILRDVAVVREQRRFLDPDNRDRLLRLRAEIDAILEEGA
ncbi:ParB family chromosome partitioning protein [Azospirillum lipoferum]|uniref:ParB/RepB/Spo0J family partition protein n=1 Tax=Azospirillum lipoferum TaxID=193 RepID=A0A5A9G2V2_AZOLI|nr:MULTISPECIES: ParB/RepB/Spo0J family partition protein [Azospirillum]KAA0588933.1 ParB/RepB/Spo0J family partition protein [Azospirillum lipoferum]MCP1615188.1 ParB family chromosome partitioning protein [Azospirillum lipoferum]MDW5537019.1 ParB/RepB/Spo0J family partition protein [Azospirillum sp. NL1]